MKNAGFTLIELLVVIAIIGVLASVTVINFSESRAESRDAQRKADLRVLQGSIELYKQKYGRYPEGCNGPWTWSAELGSGTGFECGDGSDEYIIDLAPEFMSELPTDPKPDGAGTGYMYVTNDLGTVFKIETRETVESEVVDIYNEFSSCDVRYSDSTCKRSYAYGNNQPNHCRPNNNTYRTSYALWGGYPDEPRSGHVSRYEEQRERVICDVD